MFQNVKLIVAYDGSGFSGWQLQEDARTVQGELQKAVDKALGRSTRLIASGRTDAGVHANRQVVNFLATSEIAAKNLKHHIARHLPPDIVVLSTEEVPIGFHARFSASEKTYRYRISTAKTLHPIYRNYVTHITYPLDIGAMRRAAQLFLGEHDFSPYSKAPIKSNKDLPPTNQTTIRTIRSFTVIDDLEKETIEILCTADGFLHNQMRILCGTLVSIGRGVLREDDIRDSLETGSRKGCGPTLPSCGLYLENVTYFM